MSVIVIRYVKHTAPQHRKKYIVEINRKKNCFIWICMIVKNSSFKDTRKDDSIAFQWHIL